MKRKIIGRIGILFVLGMLIVSTHFVIKNRKFIFMKNVTREQLDERNLDQYKKLMIVAHPDDELIWGGAHLLSDDYVVVCITRGYDKTRKEEFQKVMESTGEEGIILDYPDKIAGKRSNWKWWKKDIRKDIKTIINYKEWDEIVTHNEEGEYGHSHHIMTHNLVNEAYEQSNSNAQKRYFGKYYKKRELSENSGAQIEETLLLQKKELAKIYASQKNTMQKLYHMFPFENWCDESIGKENDE